MRFSVKELYGRRGFTIVNRLSMPRRTSRLSGLIFMSASCALDAADVFICFSEVKQNEESCHEVGRKC